MASGHRIRKLHRKILQAAALGSVKLLRTLLHSHANHSRKRRRKPSKRERSEDYEFESPGARRSKKRPRREAERQQREEQEIHRRGRGSDRKRYETEEESTSIEQDEDCDTREETRQRNRSRREEGRENSQNSRQEESSSEGREPADGHFSSRGSPGKQSHYGSCMESEVEEVTQRCSGYKHFATGKTVRTFVNCHDADGLSPLHHACHAGSEKLVKYLISKGASVHARDSKGDTSMHIAAKLGPTSLISILRNANADMEAFNDKGVTPSDILREKEAATQRATMFKDEQNWYSHMAEELSDNEDIWWGTEWSEDSEHPDWDVPLLEKMADSRQGRGLYSEPFSLRDFLKAENSKTQADQVRRSKGKWRHTGRASKNEERKGPEIIGPKPKVSLETQSYSQRWKTFVESYNLCVSYSSVPFPVEEGKDDTLAEVLLQGINVSMHRAALRNEMLKWHPDKFLQRWGAKLQGPDHDRIVARVNGISEAIHQLYKNLTLVK